MILALKRQFSHYKADIEAGRWQGANQFCFYNSPIQDLRGSTLGLIGTGAIATQLATLAKAFGMQTVFHSVSGRSSFDDNTLIDLPELLNVSDVVSIHCPLNDTTHNLINFERISWMKPNALLINTARGSVVDLDALVVALQNKVIAGAGIDVAPQEPPKKTDPIMKLNQLHNCIVTPHTAWASEQASEALITKVIENINAFALGKPQNIVN
jgi:glycerate dehydrogenase